MSMLLAITLPRFRALFIIFSRHPGGQRKCVGDQFAIMESIVTLAMLVRRFEFELAVKPEEVGFFTGATIHTRNGLPMRVRKRCLPRASTGDQETFEEESVSTPGKAVPA